MGIMQKYSLKELGMVQKKWEIKLGMVLLWYGAVFYVAISR
jgi:hypothetical protein